MNKFAAPLALLCLLASNAYARESIDQLRIDSPKAALLLISKDHFGDVSLAGLMSDIQSNEVYKNGQKYPQGRVAIESQNDYGHYGSVDFEFKAPFNFTRQELITHISAVSGDSPGDVSGITSFRWKSNGFNCLVDFDDSPEYPLFQYLCHYAGK